MLTAGLTRFRLELELQKDYLLSFERPGCMSKQLQFNTRVPPYAAVGGFRFPFQVTLETMRTGERTEYIGPVGYIHYDESLGEFGYSTDYRIAKDEVLGARLEKARTVLNAKETGGEHRASVKRASAKEEGLEERPAPERLLAHERVAPTARHVPPMVHVLDAPSARPATAGAEAIRPVLPEESKLAEVYHGRSGVDLQSEVLVEPLHVTTIVTRTEGMQTTEYRRVVSYYGSITYFINGRPCSADVYRQGISH